VVDARQVLVFVGGLHRSGTSLMHRTLAQHPDVAGMLNTGAPEDEGQHLQSVFLPDFRFGGAGRFAFDPAAHLTEHSALVSEENCARLLAQWGPHWRRGASAVVEKSPPNLIRARFLQALFPNALFVMVLRHPIAVAGATRKGRRRLLSFETLVHHWIHAHTILARDALNIRDLHVVRYEQLVADPHGALSPVFAAAGLTLHTAAIPPVGNSNSDYFEVWRRHWGLWSWRERTRLVTRWEPAVNQYGYSLVDLERWDNRDLPRLADNGAVACQQPPASVAYNLTDGALRAARKYRPRRSAV
jgi:hypothetical protein